MENRQSIIVWGPAVKLLSRIWVCGHCGVKVFYGRLAERPKHSCVCGNFAWRG